MKYVRAVTVELGTDKNPPNNYILSIGSVINVGPLQKSNQENVYVVTAEYSHKFKPKRTKTGLVIFPEKIRSQLENGLDIYCSLVATSLHCSKTISSCTPCIFLQPENLSDEDFLKNCNGFLHKMKNSAFPRTSYEFDIELSADHLVLRLDGVTLLSEAISCKSHSGQIHELIRYFELAFRLSGAKLIDALSNFLEKSNLGYTKNEVSHWIEVRNGITHADYRKSLYFENDSAWIVPRIMQAAYDVMFNKKSWRLPDTTRSENWRPISGTVDPNGGLLITKGAPGVINFVLFDEFCRYPLNLGANLKDIPCRYWSGPLIDNIK